MKMSPRFKTLEQATENCFMMNLLEKYCSKYLPDSGKIVSLEIPRLFKDQNRKFIIQYDLEVATPNWEQTRRILVGGVLACDSEENPGINMFDENYIKCEELPLYLMLFPNDSSLPGLKNLVHEHSLSETINTALAENYSEYLAIDKCKIEPLGWRPGRRAVVRVSSLSDNSDNLNQDYKSLIIKFVRPKKAEKLFERIRILSNKIHNRGTGCILLAPEIIASDPKTGTLVMSDLQGQNLNQLIGSDQFLNGSLQAGRTLRELHGVKGAVLPGYDWAKELQSTQAACQLTGAVFPEINSTLKDRLEELVKADNMQIEPEDQTIIHRDYYDKQVIPGEPRPAFLDLDNLSMGDPAQDVGNFIAHITLRSKQFAEHAAAILDSKAIFLKGYNVTSASFQQRISNWEKLTLIRLTCLYLLRPKWRTIAPELIGAGINKSNTELQFRGKI